MTREIRQFTAGIPAGTTAAAPFTQDMSFPPRIVRTVEIIVPPGPSGLVGFALANSGVRVIPYASDLWIITDQEKIVWPLDGYIDSGSWSLIGYNTGTVAHSIYVRFLLDLPESSASQPPAMIDDGDLSSTASDTDTDEESEEG